MIEQKFYVSHTCKNSKLPATKDLSSKKLIPHKDYCFNAFMDIDKTKVKSYSPDWKYCPECEAKGFKNPKTRKVKKTPEQIELFKQKMKEYREKKGK